MKVFGPTLLAFDEGPFCMPWGFGRPRGWFQDPGYKYRVPEQRAGVREIPIKIERKPTAEFDDIIAVDESDSEWDDCVFIPNSNNNGPPRRKRRNGRVSPVKLISSQDSLLNQYAGHYGNVIDLDTLTDDSCGACKKSEAVASPSDDDFLYSLNTVRTSDKSKKSKSVSWSENHFKEKEINETPSYSVYKYLVAFLKETGQHIDYMKGDGNCFFRALSKILYGTEWLYGETRDAVCDLMEKYPKKFEQFVDEKHISDHIKNMREDKMWATQTEIYAAATLLQRDIYILSPDQGGDNYRWLLFSPQFQYSSDISEHHCFVTLCHTHGNHYDRIVPLQAKCNCNMERPKMTGVCATVDLTNDEIV